MQRLIVLVGFDPRKERYLNNPQADIIPQEHRITYKVVNDPGSCRGFLVDEVIYNDNIAEMRYFVRDESRLRHIGDILRHQMRVEPERYFSDSSYKEVRHSFTIRDRF